MLVILGIYGTIAYLVFGAHLLTPVILIVLLAGVYLMQSSQIVTAGRHVEMLRREVTALRRALGQREP